MCAVPGTFAQHTLQCSGEARCRPSYGMTKDFSTQGLTDRVAPVLATRMGPLGTHLLAGNWRFLHACPHHVTLSKLSSLPSLGYLAKGGCGNC